MKEKAPATTNPETTPETTLTTIGSRCASCIIPLGLFSNWPHRLRETETREYLNRIYNETGINPHPIADKIAELLLELRKKPTDKNWGKITSATSQILSAISNIVQPYQEVPKFPSSQNAIFLEIKRRLTAAEFAAALYYGFFTNGGQNVLNTLIANPNARLENKPLLDQQKTVLEEIKNVFATTASSLNTQGSQYAEAVAALNRRYSEFGWEVWQEVLKQKRQITRREFLKGAAVVGAAAVAAKALTRHNLPESLKEILGNNSSPEGKQPSSSTPEKPKIESPPSQETPSPEPTQPIQPSAQPTKVATPETPSPTPPKEPTPPAKPYEPIESPPPAQPPEEASFPSLQSPIDKGEGPPSPELWVEENDAFHVVEKGDSLSKIAKKYWLNEGGSMAELIRLTRALAMINPHFPNINFIQEGRRVFVYPPQMKKEGFAEILAGVIENPENLARLAKEKGIPIITDATKLPPNSWAIFDGSRLRLTIGAFLSSLYGKSNEEVLALISRVNQKRFSPETILEGLIILPPPGWVEFELANCQWPVSIKIPQIPASQGNEKKIN